MVLLQQLCDFLDQLCPVELAESWDNVGLLLGDPSAVVTRVMTCLTVTDETVAEAVAQQASLIVSHHPPAVSPFYPADHRHDRGTGPVDTGGSRDCNL